MTKPPIQKQAQEDYVQSAVRMPAHLRIEIKRAAKRNGRTMNAEILARLQSSQIDSLAKELERLRGMIQILIDRG